MDSRIRGNDGMVKQPEMYLKLKEKNYTVFQINSLVFQNNTLILNN